MIRTRKASVTLLAGTLVWDLYLVLFLVFVGMMTFAMSTRSPTLDRVLNESPGWFVALFVVHFCMLLLGVALMAAYVVDVVRNPRLRSDSRVIWAVCVFFLAPGAMPAYWWRFLRPAVLAERTRVEPGRPQPTTV